MRSLNNEEKLLTEQRAKDFSAWKEATTSLKESMSKQETSIRAISLIKTDHDALVKQKEKLQVHDILISIVSRCVLVVRLKLTVSVSSFCLRRVDTFLQMSSLLFRSFELLLNF